MLSRLIRPCLPLIVGFLLSQTIAVLHVYHSNQRLYLKLDKIGQAGYVTVPNQIVQSSLKMIKPAWMGGFFFSFSIGLGICLLSFGLIWIWVSLFEKKKWFLGSLAVLWISSLIYFFSKGVTGYALCYFIIIPLAVFETGRRCIVAKRTKSFKWLMLIQPLVIITLLVFIKPQIDIEWFVNVRDKVLLETRIGQMINTFYYDYTLYAANAFKSLNQKLVRTAHVDVHTGQKLKQQLERRLIGYDYLPVMQNDVELTITGNQDEIVLKNHLNPVIRVTPAYFFNNTGNILKDFSVRTDPYMFFRILTFYAIIFELAVLGYLGLYLSVRLMALGILMLIKVSDRYLDLVSTLGCIVLIVGVIGMIPTDKHDSISDSQIRQWIEKGTDQQRIKALKLSIARNLDVGGYYLNNRVKAGSIPERIYLAKSLAHCRDPRALPYLYRLLNHSQINVVCMALQSLGAIGNRTHKKEIIPVVLNHLSHSRDWYNQVYAYKALRRLGWYQKKSKSEP